MFVRVALVSMCTLISILDLAAQDRGTRPGLCFRGRPVPHCGTFTITEFGYANLFSSSENSVGIIDHGYFTWQFGGMKNLSPSMALGFTLLLTADDDYGRVGLRFRLRSWLTETVTLDVSFGRFLAGGGNSNRRSFTGELALGVSDWVALTGQFERSPTGWAWYNGMKLGSELGLTVGIIAPLIVGMMVSAALN